MNAKRQILGGLLLILAPSFVQAEIELAPYAGFRFGGSFDVSDRKHSAEGELEFDAGKSYGLILNIDLDEPGKQAELYYGRHETTARTSGGRLFEAELSEKSAGIDVVIHQLQFGGLYFPGGKNTGGFVSGLLGIARLDPKRAELDNHHRASIALGGGYKILLANNLRLRLELRGIYTALDSGGGVFCSGGCVIRYQSNGYLQVEAGAGLSFRF